MWSNDRLGRLLSGLPSGSCCFRFGSSLFDAESAADIDVLIVYPDDAVDDMVRFLDETEGAALAQGLDLTALTKSEEAQVGFIAFTGAQPLTIRAAAFKPLMST